MSIQAKKCHPREGGDTELIQGIFKLNIVIKNEQDIEYMRISGKLAAEVLDYIAAFVNPGVTTNELDKICHDYIVDVQKA